MSEAAAPTCAFIAGSTGFTGRALARAPRRDDVTLRLHVRQKSSSRAHIDDPRRVVTPFDVDALAEAMDGCDACVQLIGTVRKKFDAHTSYESVDFGTTQTLLAAARHADVPHFVLLSSAGAQTGLGAYLAWKKRTEELVRNSGRGYTILRPGYLAGDNENPERAKLVGLQAFLAGLSDTPFGAPFAHLRPINIQTLAAILLDVIAYPPKNQILGGPALFARARALGHIAGAAVSQSL